MSYVGKVTAGGSTHLVGSTLYGTCDTASATAAKVVTCADFDKLETGVTIHVRFAYGNGVQNPTLNVNGTGAKPIKAGYSSSYTAIRIEQYGVYSFTYDGTNWCLNDFVVTTDTISENNIHIPTSGAVASYVATQMGDVAGALVYKGTVSAGTDLLNTALKKGWYYIVDTAGSYAGVTCEPGDMIIVNTAGTYTTASALAAAVDVIQTNIDTISNSEIDTIVAS